MIRTNYDSIADEYYDPRHVTSRNFDEAAFEFFSQVNFSLPSAGLVLELGAGKGNAHRYLRVEASQVIQSDLSWKMLMLEPREAFKARLQLDALSLPFSKAIFSTVAAFLYDPFNEPRLYLNVSSTLCKGGYFIGTLPHFSWGASLRKAINLPSKKTRFRKFMSSQEEYVELKSVLMNNHDLRRVIEKARLEIIQLTDIFLPTHVRNVSPHIQIPATALGISPYELPILKAIIARRQDEL